MAGTLKEKKSISFKCQFKQFRSKSGSEDNLKAIKWSQVIIYIVKKICVAVHTA